MLGRYHLDDFEITGFRSVEDLARHVIEKKTVLISVNALTLLAADPELARLTHSHTAYIDGMGALLLARTVTNRTGTRIAGADLWLELLRIRPSSRIYLVGATQEVVTAVAEKLLREFPDLTLCGFRNGYLSQPAEEAQLLADIKASEPEMIFIAMGQPAQEFLAARLFAAYPALYAGLGGSFDVYVGKFRRAPRWLQRIGLEWLYRLIQDPARWRRMVPLLRLLPKLIRKSYRLC